MDGCLIIYLCATGFIFCFIFWLHKFMKASAQRSCGEVLLLACFWKLWQRQTNISFFLTRYALCIKECFLFLRMCSGFFIPEIMVICFWFIVTVIENEMFSNHQRAFVLNPAAFLNVAQENSIAFHYVCMCCCSQMPLPKFPVENQCA